MCVRMCVYKGVQIKRDEVLACMYVCACKCAC